MSDVAVKDNEAQVHVRKPHLQAPPKPFIHDSSNLSYTQRDIAVKSSR